MKRYLKLWFLWSQYTSEIALQSRFGALLFVIGKLIRFAIFLFFIILITTRVNLIAGYSLWQMIFLFATFNFIDIVTQLFLREVYRFRFYVVSGEMDYHLVRPVYPLFKFLFGGADLLDFPVFIISIIFLIFSAIQIGPLDLYHISIYAILIFNALVIALSFHIIVLALGILTAEVDNTLWLYRDLTAMGKIPIDLYKEPIRSLITFVVPVGIMMTFPVKALLGKLSMELIVLSIILSLSFIILSYLSWKFALRRYASASS